MTKFQPLYDRIVIRRIDVETTYKGIIHLPETSQQKPQMGVVVAVGQGRFDNGAFVELMTREGDKVLFGKYTGTDIRLNDEDLVIMREDDILGIVTEDA